MDTNKVISAPGASHHFRCRRQGDVLLRHDGKSPPRHPALGGAGSMLHMKRCGDPGAIRTHDPQIRNLMLYRSETYVSARIAAIAGAHCPPVSGLFSVLFCAGSPAWADGAGPLAGQCGQRSAHGRTGRRAFIVFPSLRPGRIDSKPLALRSKVDVSCVYHVRARMGCMMANDPESVSGARCNRGRVPCVYS